jgi:hypothetical protein
LRRRVEDREGEDKSMIVGITYYLGLTLCAFAVGTAGYLSEETERAFSGPFSVALIGYYVLGWYLFSWEIGIANLFVFILLLTLPAFLANPIDRLVKTFFPAAEYRWTISPDLRAKLGRAGRRVGFGRGNNR